MSSSLPPGPRSLRERLDMIAIRKADPLGFYRELTRRYGDVAMFKIGRITNVFVTHPDGVQRVLQTNAKNYVKGPGYERLRSFLGNGLLTSEGEHWRRQRRLAAPAFHQNQLREACNGIVHVGRELLERWDRQTRPELDLAVEMNAAALSIVQRALFGSETTGRAEDVRTALQRALRFTDAGGTAWLRIIDTLIPTREQNLAFKIERYLPIPSVLGFNRSVSVLRGVVTELIESRRKSGDYGNDLLGAMMKARDEEDGSHMTTPQLRDEVMTMMNAGHETTATALSWSWLMLDRHRELAMAIRREVLDVLGDREPAFEDLPRLTLTQRFFEEVMRHYPPFWRISRRALEEDEIQGHRIPAGSVLVVSPYLTHRDARFWPNPEAFDPDRFDPAQVAQRHRFAYLPFGGGSRVCIGANFAFIEALVLLSMIIRRYDFELKPGYQLEPEATITLKPRQGVPVRFKRREGAR